MGLSKLCEKCRKCPKVDTCNNKRMEAFAFFDGPCEREMAASTATEGTVVITPADNWDAFLDKIEEQIALAAQIPQHILCKHYPHQ